MRTRVAIVGGGLAGLHAAMLLKEAGVEHALFEARATFGGRLLSASFGAGAFDLGAAWFWPRAQPALGRLVSQLRLATFSQHDHGALLFEDARRGVERHAHAWGADEPSMRIAGGMKSLVDAVLGRLEPGRLHAQHFVERIEAAGDGLRLIARAKDGTRAAFEADACLMALPPRLAAGRAIDYLPALPERPAASWRATPTWMAPHAKYLAVYAQPFWRDAGLSGEARSHAGPMVEMHDASSPGGPAGLFGFLGVPARSRHAMPPDALKALCRAQLARLFGPAAMTPVAEWLQDWSTEPLTATAEDLHDAASTHGRPMQLEAQDGPWAGRIVGIASEWSPAFPGYIAGAVDAATRGVSMILAPGAMDRSLR